MRDIIARQGYSSSSMKDFKFIERYNLSRYSNEYDPVVVFGAYHLEDNQIVDSHKGDVIMFWMGVDSWRVYRNPEVFRKPNVVNISDMLNVINFLADKGVKCHLVKPFKLRGEHRPVKKGNKVYTYVNKNKPEYYGSELIKSLNTPFEILVGDYSISQDDWFAGRNDEYFDQCFVGMALSSYAGGGSGIIECGARGLKCITNLMNLPNTINWENKEDIEKAIMVESEKIGTIDNELAKSMNDYLPSDDGEFNLNKMLI
jgi:hypothetical protein